MTRSQKHNLIGIALILLGVIFLFENFDVDVWGYIWPLAILLFGIYLIVRSGRKSDGRSGLSEFRVLGDARHAGYTGEIDGTSISHFIGDVELNLTGAQLKSGVNRMTISMFIGDVEIKVPPDVPVSASCSATFGDIHVLDQKRQGIFLSVRHKSSDYDAADKKLHLSCSAFIGDIVVTRIQPTSTT